MADPDDKPDDAARSECRPCHGSGVVISGLGGEQRQLTCPWCDGTGAFMPGRDAQTAAPAVS